MNMLGLCMKKKREELFEVSKRTVEEKIKVEKAAASNNTNVPKKKCEIIVSVPFSVINGSLTLIKRRLLNPFEANRTQIAQLRSARWTEN